MALLTWIAWSRSSWRCPPRSALRQGMPRAPKALLPPTQRPKPKLSCPPNHGCRVRRWNPPKASHRLHPFLSTPNTRPPNPTPLLPPPLQPAPTGENPEMQSKSLTSPWVHPPWAPLTASPRSKPSPSLAANCRGRGEKWGCRLRPAPGAWRGRPVGAR